jgi:hypothetical protein
LRMDAVECRPSRIEEIAEIRRRMPSDGMLFVEAPQGCSLEETIAAVANAGACAKIRTGGIVAEAIPASSAVAAFLVVCVRHRVRLKATAGLHHGIRGLQKLTYEHASATASMHGFVNFFVAAAAAHEGADEAEIAAILEDGEVGDFNASGTALEWRARKFSLEAIREMRDRFAISFGSCSFEEPVEEMSAMGWIE